MVLKLIGGVVVLTGLSFALLVLPALHHSSSIAAQVMQALEAVNTWHLRGWKLQDGKPIPWEVWGRRAPFFYREQVGSDLVLDDSRQRISLFAPLTRTGLRPTPGIALITPSMPEDENVRWSYKQMVTMWRGDLKPWAETAEGPVFNFPASGIFIGGDRGSATDLLYTVDRSTWLPMYYEARLGKGDAKQTIAMLTADYNTPIPADLMAAPTAPSGYQTYDTTQPVARQSLENAVTVQGITVQTTPILMDQQGNILLRIRDWLGSRLIDRNSSIGVNVWADRWADANHHLMRTPANTDDEGRAYTQVDWGGVEWGSSDLTSHLMMLTPTEPLVQGSPRPTTLTVRLTVSVSMDSRLRGTMGMGDSQLSTHGLTLTISLPAPAAPSVVRSELAALDHHWRSTTSSDDGLDDLTAAIDQARGSFFGAVIDHRHLDTEHLQRSTYWQEQYIKRTSAHSGKQLEHFCLARLYHLLGNNVRARQLLKESLDNTHYPTPKRWPSETKAQFQQVEAENRQIYEENRRSAEEALRTWTQ